MNTKQPSKSEAVRTRRVIVNLLKREGLMDAEALAERLNITAMAVRQHLYALQKEHLVTYQEEQPQPEYNMIIQTALQALSVLNNEY
ncbi:MAG: ArsR family transcriptional regulator [Microcoleus sp. SIO2G3]|nr:ArsR family transcriptional regulator [Microcoleus sp. SIO2G3]